MRLAILILFALLWLIVLSGCTAPVQLPDTNLVDGWVAAMVATAVMQQAAPEPQPIPPPAPAPAWDCKNCGGTGKLPGDGVIKPTCPACDGTGKAKNAAPAAAKKIATTVRVDAESCVGGACSTPSIRTPLRRLRLR